MKSRSGSRARPGPNMRVHQRSASADPVKAGQAARKHLSSIKGGRLAETAAPARLATLIVSDVVGDDISVIASGPTIADPTTCADALAVLARYAIAVPNRIRNLLETGALETPKRLPASEVHVVARPADALAAAASYARGLGLAVLDLSDAVAGEARMEAAEQAAEAAAAAAAGLEGPVGADRPKVEPKRDALGRSYATGRRKESTARVWIKAGKGPSRRW